MKPFTEEDRYLYDLTPDSIVIDAGAHKGDFTAEIVRRHDCTVHTFEPIRRFFNETQMRLVACPKVCLSNSGIGSKTEMVRMWVKGDSSGRFADTDNFEDVQMTDAATLPFADLFKLNIEGGEFDVLEHCLKEGVIGRFKNIQVQFHPVVPNAEARYQAIRAALLKTHHLTFDAPWVWQNYRLNE